MHGIQRFATQTFQRFARNAGTLDADALDASALDASALDASALNADALDADAPDASALDADVLDADVPDADVLDADAPASDESTENQTVEKEPIVKAPSFFSSVLLKQNQPTKTKTETKTKTPPLDEEEEYARASAWNELGITNLCAPTERHAPDTSEPTERHAPQKSDGEDRTCEELALISKGIPEDYLRPRWERATRFARSGKRRVTEVLTQWWAQDRPHYRPSFRPTYGCVTAHASENKSYNLSDFVEAALVRSYGGLAVLSGVSCP